MNFSNKLKLGAPKPARTQSPKTLGASGGQIPTEIMLEKDFPILLDKITQIAQDYSFRIDNHLYSPEAFGNFFISFTNDKLTCRLVNDRGQHFLEVSVDKNQWVLLTDFVAQKYNSSTLNLDLKLHNMYVTDFSLENNIKLLPKFLLLTNS